MTNNQHFTQERACGTRTSTMEGARFSRTSTSTSTRLSKVDREIRQALEHKLQSIIETKQVFSVLSVVTCLQQCYQSIAEATAGVHLTDTSRHTFADSYASPGNNSFTAHKLILSASKLAQYPVMICVMLTRTS